MDRRSFTIVFLIAVFVAIFFGFVGKFSENTTTENLPNASPSSQPTNFASPKDQNNIPTSSQLQPENNRRKFYDKFPGVYSQADLTNKKVTIKTARGNIEIEIFPDSVMASSNFLFLVGEKFYDNLTFHRVEKGFVVQGGDPLGNGRGGPGYVFEDEKVTRKYEKGIVAMANAGPNTNGSQFFIMLDNHPELEPKYTIFGKVIAGMDIVSKIQVGDLMESVVISDL